MGGKRRNNAHGGITELSSTLFRLKRMTHSTEKWCRQTGTCYEFYADGVFLVPVFGASAE